MINDAPVKIKDIGVIKQVVCGLDHVLFLTKQGDVMAMGDDTFGQCGTGGDGRALSAPFFQARHRTPVKTSIPKDAQGKL